MDGQGHGVWSIGGGRWWTGSLKGWWSYEVLHTYLTYVQNVCICTLGVVGST